MGFLENWTSAISQLTDAHHDLIEASGLYLLSTAVQRNWQIMTLSDLSMLDFDHPEKISGRLLNLWVFILGPSRITRKTTIINKVDDMIEFLNPELKVPYDFSPQSLVTDMKSKYIETMNETRATWICDECSSFFSLLAKSNSYMAGTDATLSKIYDGRTFAKETIARGKEEIKKPYLTCILGSTFSCCQYFTKEMMLQGFFNRFIFFPLVHIQDWKPLGFSTANTEVSKKLKDCREFLSNCYHKSLFTYMKPDEGAKEIWDIYERGIHEKIKGNGLGLSEGYYGNLPNLALKIAALFRINRIEGSLDASLLNIEKQDMERGILFAGKMWENFNTILEYRVTPYEKTVTTTEDYEFKVLAIINRQPRKEIHRSQLLTLMKLDSGSLDKVVNTLSEQGKISSRMDVNELKSGRPPIVYFIVSSLVN